MPHSPLPPPRLEIFKYERDGKTCHKAFCELNNGTGDWAIISMVDGICADASWRKKVTVEAQILKYRGEGAQLDLPSTGIDGPQREMLEKLAAAAQKYNKNKPPLIVDEYGAIVHAGSPLTGDRARATTPSGRRTSMRNLHVWI